MVSGEPGPPPAGWELLFERLCMEGQKLSQKWGTASTLKPPAEGLWAFYRPFLKKGCACFPEEVPLFTPTLCHPKQSDSGPGVCEVQWASSTATV